MTNGTATVRASELGLVLLAAGVLFAALLFEGLFDRDTVLFGVDTATAQLPWSGLPVESGGENGVENAVGPLIVANPALADQGMVFYPVYRWLLSSWSSGEFPYWNPLLYAGAPALGNPQLGVLDPQVWALAAVEWLGGAAAADHALAWIAWLRLVAAAVGTYLLARTLRLGRPGAALASFAFATSGFVVGWLNHSLGHVAFFLPWVLLFLERLHGPRPARALVASAVVFALAVLGGHPETAFYIGFAAGLWALSYAFVHPEGEQRAHRIAAARGLIALGLGTALAGCSLLPFFEYLTHSGAMVARGLAPPPGEPDWLALGVVLVALGACLRWGSFGRRTGTVPIALFLAAAILLLFRHAASPAARLLFWPDLFGAPGKTSGGYYGAGSYLEEASTWIAPAALVLALAATLAPRVALAEDVGLRRKGWIAAIGFTALLLALRAPGWIDLYRHVPFIGLAATVRMAPVAALMIALLAGEGLERAPRSARIGSVFAIGALVVASLFHAPLPDLPPTLRAADPPDGMVAFTRTPIGFGAVGFEADGALEGWIHPGLPVASVRARAARWTEDTGFAEDTGFELPCELALQRWSETGKPRGAAPTPPDGAQWFRSSFLWFEYLDEGHWRFEVDFFDAAGNKLGSRVAGVATVERRPRPGSAAVALVTASLAAVAFVSVGAGGTWGFVVLVILAGFWFGRGLNPAVPRERCFPPTATEAVLAEELWREVIPRRYLSDPGVLPANTGLVRGLPALDGYDGLDPASFDGYRAFALAPGVQPLLGWNARGMDLDSAAFRLFGVGALVLAAPLEHPDWELVAAPFGQGGQGGQAAQESECWIYRARDPMPRAFCVNNAVSKAAVLQDLPAFDPVTTAFLEEGEWHAPQPFTNAEVEALEYRSDRVRLAASLDGDGLLVLTEQHFPGWRVSVDGESRELLRVNSIFRGVVLAPGEHEVQFDYRPWSSRIGLLASLTAAAALAALLCLKRLFHDV